MRTRGARRPSTRDVTSRAELVERLGAVVELVVRKPDVVEVDAVHVVARHDVADHLDDVIDGALVNRREEDALPRDRCAPARTPTAAADIAGSRGFIRPRSSASGRGTISHSGCVYTMCLRAAGGSASDTRFTLTHACTFRPARCARSSISSSGSNDAGCFASTAGARLVPAVVVRIASAAHLHDERVESAGLRHVDGGDDAGGGREAAALHPQRADLGMRCWANSGPQASATIVSVRATPADNARTHAERLGNVRKRYYELSPAGSRCSSSRSRGSMSSPIASRTESCAFWRRAIACV